MSADEKSVNLILDLDSGDDGNANELDSITRQLLSEIQTQDVESIELVRGIKLQEGAKAVDTVTLGALAIVVLPVILPKLIEFLQSWVLRTGNPIIKIKKVDGDKSWEYEFPSSMSPDELELYVAILSKVQ